MLGKCAHTASLASKRFECEVKRESYPSPCRSFRRVVRFFLSPSPWNLRPRSSPSPSRHLFTSPPLPIPIPSILFPRVLREIARSGRDWQASISIAERLSPPSLFHPLPSPAFSRRKRKENPRRSQWSTWKCRTRRRIGPIVPISDRSGRVSKSYSVTDEIDARCMDPR